jgi:phosphate transport system permease protein
VVVLGAGLVAAIQLSGPLARTLFAGDFQNWLLTRTGLAYDQRNAIVVGIAMGFAVIPIIFAISEDAFANVPSSLVSGSLALGANRWQTVTRVVLPTASPGIFSAVMVGFGRAVGETMIVLMATGNTPIMDWSPFNGFRTLSANIAVEIPEAPQFGTLYRVLFLAALLLFALTFVVNTAAEVVRHRLRQRYGQL